MAVVFCCPYDSNFDACGGISPDYIQNYGIDTTIKKFGNGSIVSNNSVATKYWLSPAFSFGNVGSIAFWVLYSYLTGTETVHVKISDQFSGFKNRIDVYVNNTKLSQHKMELYMRDNTNAQRVNAVYTEAALTTGWHYYELNFFWNDASGLSELSVDGNVKISNTGGNSYSRAGSSTWNTEFNMPIFQGPLHADDFTFMDERAHTGNFSVPTVPNCVCAAIGQISFGSQMNRFGAGFSR